jgi:hypothetical protein
MNRKPEFCPYIYSDGVKLFLEFDNFVLDFVFSEAGLHKALKHVPNVARQPGYVSGKSNLSNGLKRKLPEVKIARKTKSDRAAKALPELPNPEGVNDIVRMLREGKFK